MLDEYRWNYPLVVVAPVVGLTVAVLGHLALAWLTGGAHAYRCVLRGFLCGAAATIGVSAFGLWFTWPAGFTSVSPALPLEGFLAYLLFNLVIYAALGFCYINFVGLSIASLRIRVLQELMARPEGMSLEKILESYNPRVLIDNRIDRLTSGRQIVDRDGRFHTGRRDILWIARIMNFMKVLVFGKRRRSSM